MEASLFVAQSISSARADDRDGPLFIKETLRLTESAKFYRALLPEHQHYNQVQGHSTYAKRVSR
jgi:hypothetical protein